MELAANPIVLHKRRYPIIQSSYRRANFSPRYSPGILRALTMSIALSPPSFQNPRLTPLVSTYPSLNFPSIRLHPRCHLRRRLPTLVTASARQDTAVWVDAPITLVEPVAESLFHVTVDVSGSGDLAASFTRAGQYLQLRVPEASKPSFLAIASPPLLATSRGVFEFLVKNVEGSTAELVCGLGKGDVVGLSQVMGKGFDVDRIGSPQDYPTVLIFATGSGISPVRSLIESDFSVNKRSDVRLYYGARNLKKMAYQDRFKDWESFGVKIVPVLSQPDDNWSGETGYVQAAFARSKSLIDPLSTGAVLCGQKEMNEEVTSILVGDGVSGEKILKNF